MAEVLLNQEQIKRSFPTVTRSSSLMRFWKWKWASVLCTEIYQGRRLLVQGTLPGKAGNAGRLMIEMLAQAGAVCILSQPEFKGKIASVQPASTRRSSGRQVVPGDVLDLEVEIIAQRGPVGVGKAIAA